MIHKAIFFHKQKLGLREGRVSYQVRIIVDGEVYSRNNHNPCKCFALQSTFQTSFCKCFLLDIKLPI